jgi:hypothetical protein
MYPTRGQIKLQFQNLLDDPTGAVFDESVFAPAFNEAYEALFTAFLTNQCPRIELLTYVMVPAMTTSMTPQDMGLTDWGDYIYLSERRWGSSDQYIDLTSVDRLTQRKPTDRLVEFNYRDDTFFFIGATQTIDLEVKYDTSGTAPADDSTQIRVDGCSPFLSNYSVGVAGGRKGYPEIAARCMSLAVGPKYDMGTIGGELFRIIQHRVRSRQKVQIAPKPYSASRRMIVRRAIPYVAAQMGTTGGGSTNVPVEYSTATGGIIGPVNGSNAVFWINAGGVRKMVVMRNGVGMTDGFDYNTIPGSNQITFVPGSIPQPGDIVTAEVYFQ